MRRIHDAGFATPFAVIPTIVFWINLFGITYIEHTSKWILLVFAVITTLAAATISNARLRRNHNYQFGYQGPVNLTSEPVQPIHQNRVEPTVAEQKESNLEKSNLEHSESPIEFQNSKNQELRGSYEPAGPTPTISGWEDQLGQWLQENRKQATVAIGIILLLTFVILLLPVFSQPDKADALPTEEVNSEPVITRSNKLEMPDQFWLMLDQNNALTIAWEGDLKTKDGVEKNYWSASTGKGDKDCVDLHFSLGENLRTMEVTVKNGGDYYADFSPVDTEIIVKSIADKDRFKLCGYEFTLKGTRALLRKNKRYAEYLKIDL